MTTATLERPYRLLVASDGGAASGSARVTRETM
jgi:hypothetical protein